MIYANTISHIDTGNGKCMFHKTKKKIPHAFNQNQGVKELRTLLINLISIDIDIDQGYFCIDQLYCTFQKTAESSLYFLCYSGFLCRYGTLTGDHVILEKKFTVCISVNDPIIHSGDISENCSLKMFYFSCNFVKLMLAGCWIVMRVSSPRTR